MPAEYFAVPLGPFGRYRHGCDPPKRHLRLSFLSWILDCEHVPLACHFNFFPLSIISQRLLVIEPFVNGFRRTTTQFVSLKPASKGQGSERKR
jgi:hypothetical protein